MEAVSLCHVRAVAMPHKTSSSTCATGCWLCHPQVGLFQGAAKRAGGQDGRPHPGFVRQQGPAAHAAIAATGHTACQVSLATRGQRHRLGTVVKEQGGEHAAKLIGEQLAGCSYFVGRRPTWRGPVDWY